MVKHGFLAFVVLGLITCHGCQQVDTTGEDAFKMAEKYRTGHGKVESPPVAKDYYQKGAAAGHTPSMIRLAWCYQFGYGTPNNLEEAHSWVEKAAQKGHVSAIRQLGFFAQWGIGTQQDLNEAIRLYTRAYEAGDVDSLALIGSVYLTGIHQKDDRSKAMKYSLEACLAGSMRGCALNALTNQASLLRNVVKVGIVTDSDREQLKKSLSSSEEYLQKDTHLSGGDGYTFLYTAELQNNPEGELFKTLNQRIRTEIGLKNPDAYMLRAAIGMFKLRKSDNLELLHKDVFEGAKAGIPTCMYLAGYNFLGGYGTGQDYNEAKVWLEKASDRGVFQATGMLGNLYQFGHGVQGDYKMANKLFLDAAQYGDDYSMINLGYNYEYGQGFTRSRENAIYWYKKASDLGNGDAKEALRRLGVTR